MICAHSHCPVFPPPQLTVTDVCLHEPEAVSTGPGYFYINITDIPFSTYPPQVSTYIAAADALMMAMGSTNLYVYRAPYAPSDNYNSIIINAAKKFVTVPIWIINKSASPVLAQSITAAQVGVGDLTMKGSIHLSELSST